MNLIHRVNLALVLLTLMLSVLAGLPALAQTSAQSSVTPSVDHLDHQQADHAARCAALQAMDFSGLTDAPTQITKTEVGRLYPDLPETCIVDGTIRQNIGFRMALPLTGWNGKFFQSGCGGACGTTRPYYCDGPVTRGYACLTTDMGRSGSSRDWSWGYNNVALLADFGFRSTHMASITGKAITEAFYHGAPRLSYFYGCSTGGRQALVEAQQFPWDFDGIIAGAPVINWTGAGMQILWTNVSNHDANGQELLKEKDVRLLHAAVIQQCDANDGVKDGLIGDPRLCKFNPAVLLCKPGQSGSCLSAQQVAAAGKIYAGPHTSDGRSVYTGGLMPGSELLWIGDFITPDGKPPIQYSGDSISKLVLGGSVPPDWTPAQFNFDRDYQRVGMVEPLFSGSNPDLRKFQARGGKLIGFQGWDDQSIVPLNYLDYYQTVVKTMGGLKQTQNFYRMFMVPGMDHCTFSGAGADAIDYLSHLEEWVEKGQAPEVIIGSHFNRDAGPPRSLSFPLPPQNVTFTRPLFPYPGQYRYKGKGDVNAASSFKQVNVP
jgi:feruloyl esterase